MSDNKISLVMFDLDGTLVDSIPDLAWCADHTLKQLGMSPLGESRLRDFLGNGAYVYVKRFLTNDLDGEPDVELYEKALPMFWETYRNNSAQFSQLYPGVTSGLESLKAKGFTLACVTNKAADFTDGLLKHLDIYDHFEQIVSGDTLAKKKPDPMQLLHVAETHGKSMNECLMVGDSRHDIAAARNAGMRVVAVPYGYNHGEDIADSNPDAVIESMDELLGLIELWNITTG